MQQIRRQITGQAGLTMMLRSESIRDVIRRARNFSALSVFFFVPWWLRLSWGLPTDVYFAHFLITIPWALTLILWTLSGFGGGDAWRRILPWLIPWILFLIWTFASQWWANFPDPAWDSALQAIAVGLFGIALATAAPPIIQIIAALSAGLLVQSVLAIVQAILQRPVGLTLLGEFQVDPGGSGLSVLKVNGHNWLRPYGLTVHPNMLGGFLAVALLGIFAVLVFKPMSRRWQGIAALLCAIGLWALLLSFSRSAWLGFGVGIGVLILWWRLKTYSVIAWPRLYKALIIGAVLTCIFVFSYRDLVFARTGLGDESGELRSVSDRLLFGEYALRMISEHPIIGVGVGMNAWEAAQMIQADPRQIDMEAQSVHDIPLLLWSELGAVGLILWLLTLGGAAWIVIHSAPANQLILALVAGIIALIVIGFLDFYTWGIFQYALLWWGLVGAVVGMAARRSALHPAQQIKAALSAL